MWQSSVLLLLIAIPFGYAANSTDGNTTKSKHQHDPNCTTIRQELFLERQKCISKFIKHQTQNDTATLEPDGYCTNLDVIKNDFSRRLNNYSRCFSNDNNTIISSMKTRLEILLNVTKDKEKLKDFLNNGLECITKYGKIIQDKCLKEVLKNETKTPTLKISLSRTVPFLNYGTRSCSKNSVIMKCTMDIIKMNCPRSNAGDFVSSLQKIIINDHCNSTKNATYQGKPKKASSTAGIIVGIIVAIFALLILGHFVIKKIKNRSKSQAEYRVSYQHEPKEK